MVTVSALSSDEEEVEEEQEEDEDEEEESQPRVRISRSQQAGLIFPVGRIERKLRKMVKERIAGGAPVYIASVLEYLIAEIIEVAGNCAASHNKRRIVPRDILLGVQGDEELAILRDGVIMPNTGRPISLHAALLPDSSRLRLSKAKRKKLEEEDVRKFKARSRNKQEQEEDSDEYPPTDDIDEDRYFPKEYRMTSPKPWPLHKVIPSRMRNPKYKVPKAKGKARDSPALPDEDMSSAPSSPPGSPPTPPVRPTKTPHARKTVPERFWKRGSSVHKDNDNNQNKRTQRSPSLPRDEETENHSSSDNESHTDDFHRKKLKEAKSRPAPLSSSFREVTTAKKKKKQSDNDNDSGSDGNDSHTDDFHRKKLKEAKGRPAPLSSSFREVTTKKRKRTARLPSPPEDDDEDDEIGKYDASYESYFPRNSPVHNWDDQPNTFFDDTVVFDDGSDDDVLPDLPGIKPSSNSKTAHERQHSPPLPVEDSPSSSSRRFGSIRSPPEFPNADKDSSDGDQSIQLHTKQRKKQKKKKTKQYEQSQDPPVPNSDKEASDGSDSDIGSKRSRDEPESQGDDFARDKLPVDSLLQNRNRVLPPPLSTSYPYRRSASPGSTQKQKVRLHNQRKGRSRSKSRLNRESNFESSQESSQRSNRERSTSSRPREFSSQQRETSRVSAPPEFPEFDLTQTTQGSRWADSVYGASSQLSEQESQASQSQPKIRSRPATPRSRAPSQPAQGDIEERSTLQAVGEVDEMELDELDDDDERDELDDDSPGTDGDDEHESDEETQPEGLAPKVSPELEETPPTRRLTSQTSAATSAAGSPPPGPVRRPATFRAQSTSTGLDPDSQVERALYTADEIAESVLDQETYHDDPSSEAPTSRDSLFGSRESLTSAPTSKEESQQQTGPTPMPRLPQRAVSQPRSKRERVSTATVSASMVKDRQVIEISSGEEDVYDNEPGDGDEVIFVKEERLTPPVRARPASGRPATTFTVSR